MAASVLPIFASDDGLTLRPVADTTVTQVPQDGDNSVKTTLASCPALCDGNPRGRRDATLQFAVDKLPANATKIKAKLRVYAWHDFDARIVARAVPGDLRAAGPAQLAGPAVQAVDEVRKGYNEFDMSSAVRANGTYTFALSQESMNTRVYWASRENSKPDLHPELVLSYETTTRPSTPSTVLPPATTSPTPSAPPSQTVPPTSRPPATTTAPAPPPTTTTTTPPPAEPAGWKLVFSDEFTGTGIDRSKWNLRDEGRDIDVGCNTSSPKNQFVSDGNLTIRALRENVVCNKQTRQYSQGYLDTIGKHSWTYGRFEMRAKSPNKPGAASKGLWPAFWLRPNDGGNGEIDVTELPGGDGWYTKSTAAIFYDYSPVKQDTRIALPGGGYPGDGFHTYTTEWDANSLKWYIDGKLVWTRDKNTTPWYDKAFHKPYNLRLNFQVGGWLGNPDAATQFPADFVVDYVRVYQR
jgi:beta-glucanase (GH16 family)